MQFVKRSVIFHWLALWVTLAYKHCFLYMGMNLHCNTFAPHDQVCTEKAAVFLGNIEGYTCHSHLQMSGRPKEVFPEKATTHVNNCFDLHHLARLSNYARESGQVHQAHYCLLSSVATSSVPK